jgi:predicted TIM-barrel fold metal-dependent hydrolase
MSFAQLDQPFIDAHHHFVNFSADPYPALRGSGPIPFRYGDLSPLRRNYLPDDFARDTAGCAPVKTVHMEAEWDHAAPVAETRWLETLKERTGKPDACVAHATLDHDEVVEVLAAQAESPLVRGIRHKPRAARSPSEARRGAPGSMDDEKWRRGYALLRKHGLSYDLQAPWWDLNAAADLAREFPHTMIIINHTGLPEDRSSDGLAGWRRALDHCAQEPNITIKISGLGLPDGRWTIEENAPIMREAIGIFGSERCMFASNFPVDGICATYKTVLRTFLTAIEGRSLTERRMLLHDNAQRIYRL